MVSQAPLPDERGVILMVDDNDDERDVAMTCFERSGLSNPFTMFADADSLLSELRASNDDQEAPVLVLADINMPEKDGFYCLEQIKQHLEETRMVLVLMLTNSDSPADIRRAQRLGADGYQVKPTDIDEYTEFFRRLVA